MRSLVAAIPLALCCVVTVTSSADARRYRHHNRHHAELRSQDVNLRSQLGAMKNQIADLRKEISGLRNVWAMAPQAAIAPKAGEPTAEIIAGDAGASLPSSFKLAALPPPDSSVSESRGTISELAEARAYLISTAHPGGTMTRLGSDRAIDLLHPDFAVRLAAALREARDIGMSDAGVFSAYRPPGFGVGGFRDKYRSLHSYGLATDIYGIGGPGSAKARSWHRIAARHGVACVYGPNNRAEWNHCQGTKVRAANSSLRRTINSRGPIDPETMWAAARGIVAPVLSVVASLGDLPVVERTRIRRPHTRRHRVHHRRHHRRYA